VQVETGDIAVAVKAAVDIGVPATCFVIDLVDLIESAS